MGLHIRTGEEAEPEVMADINTTPLVDVLLVLLVMLIITIPIQLHAVSVEMPGLSAPPPPQEPQVVTIDVTPAGSYLWNGEPVAEVVALQQKLGEAAARPQQPEIHLQPDRRAKYDAVAAALAAAQRQGLVKIGLVGADQFTP